MALRLILFVVFSPTKLKTHLPNVVARGCANTVRNLTDNANTIICGNRHAALTGDPVNSDAFHPADAGGDDVLPPGLVAFGAGDSVQTHVCPVHSVVSCEMHNAVNEEREKRLMNAAAANGAARETTFYDSSSHFTKCCVGLLKRDGEKIPTELHRGSVLTHSA